MKFFAYTLLTVTLTALLFITGCSSTPPPPPPHLAPVSTTMRQRAAEWQAVWEDFAVRGVVITPVARRFYRDRDARLIERLAMLGVNCLYLQVENRKDLDDMIASGRLATIVSTASAAGIGTELVLAQKNFMPERYGNVIRRRIAGSADPLTGAVDRILQYNAENPPERSLTGVTVMPSIHTFRNGAGHLPANLLYAWSPERYGAGSDNDLLMMEWFRQMAEISRRTDNHLPLTAAFPIFYQERAATGDLSAGSAADFLGWCDRAWIIGTGTRPSQLLSSLRTALESVDEPRRVICGVVLASHLSEDSGALRRRDWPDLLRSIKTIAAEIRNSPAAAGMVVDSWDEWEWLWEQE